ncbi:hypothetical protein PanWU01x14_182760, partial [Parasponia andersonii]
CDKLNGDAANSKVSDQVNEDYMAVDLFNFIITPPSSSSSPAAAAEGQSLKLVLVQ